MGQAKPGCLVVKAAASHFLPAISHTLPGDAQEWNGFKRNHFYPAVITEDRQHHLFIGFYAISGPAPRIRPSPEGVELIAWFNLGLKETKLLFRAGGLSGLLEQAAGKWDFTAQATAA